MVKLLSSIVLILAIILFPPAVLALVSNNALPGDSTYPIKRLLEDGIYAVASLNPTSKAWFSAARSDRRFKEFSTLIAQGKSASNTLSELVIQTDIAAEEIKKVDDPVKKQQLIVQLSESINKYDQKLDEVSTAPSVSPIQPQPVAAVPTPTVKAPTPKTSTSIVVTPKPSEITKPKETPKPSVSEVNRPTAPSQGSVSSEDVEDAKKKFEEIKKKLDEEKKQTPLTKEENKDKIEKKGNEGDSHSGAGANSEPAGSVKTKNEK